MIPADCILDERVQFVGILVLIMQIDIFQLETPIPLKCIFSRLFTPTIRLSLKILHFLVDCSGRNAEITGKMTLIIMLCHSITQFFRIC